MDPKRFVDSGETGYQLLLKVSRMRSSSEESLEEMIERDGEDFGGFYGLGHTDVITEMEKIDGGRMVYKTDVIVVGN